MIVVHLMWWIIYVVTETLANLGSFCHFLNLHKSERPTLQYTAITKIFFVNKKNHDAQTNKHCRSSLFEGIM